MAGLQKIKNRIYHMTTTVHGKAHVAPALKVKAKRF